MLSEKPWKPEAIVRLILGVMICVFAGSFLVNAMRFFTVGGKASPWLFGGLTAGASMALSAALVAINKPWPLESFMRRLMVFLTFLYAGLALGAWAQHLLGVPADKSVLNMVIVTLCFQGAAVVLISRFLREHQIGWGGAFGFAGPGQGRALLLGVLVALIFLPIGWGLQMASAQVMTQIQIKPVAQQAIQALQTAEVWPDRIYLGVVAILLAPVAEEMLFRGILYPAIKQAGFPRVALWGTALLFAATHHNAATFLPLALLAVALALLYEKTNNLLAPITAHSLFNAMNFLVLYLVQQKSGQAGW
jgi:membrane protease YdiL (CAAX protease family)